MADQIYTDFEQEITKIPIPPDKLQLIYFWSRKWQFKLLLIIFWTIISPIMFPRSIHNLIKKYL
jgi:hypothetical protein